jgi:8-amino-7-oxononanoate synthase
MAKPDPSSPDRSSVEAFAAKRLAELEAQGLRRDLHATRRAPDAAATRDGGTFTSFCDNDYLALSTHPRVTAAAAAAAQQHGVGAGASRLVTGDHPLNHRLERRLAVLKGLPAARLFGSGYLANVGVVPAVVGPGDLVVMDGLAHACLHAGARLSGAEVRLFAHNDVEEAARLLRNRRGGRALVVTETVFSMDGDLAPLEALAAACGKHDAWLMTDDAHGFGVVKIDNPAAIQMGTLSKAVGGYGGYVAGPAALVELLASRARSFVYTTGLPPPTLAAALAALEVMEEEPARRETCLANARLFGALIGRPEVHSAIVPVVMGEAARAMAASEALAAEGFLVSAIRPPTVPAGTARLRFTFSAAHREADVRRLAALTRRLIDAAAA